MSGATKLYSPEVLALATSLARWPLDEGLALRGEARAPVCGSRIELGLQSDNAGRITRFGFKVHACAIGQASAAIFAGHAEGSDRGEIEAALVAIERWQTDPTAPVPDWPGFEAIAAAREYPARHGAIMLAWKAALAALP